MRAWLYLFIYLSGAALLPAETISSPMLEKVRQATSRVVAQRPDGAVVGTAFLFGSHQMAVTCLHVVGNASQIKLVFPSGERTGTLRKILRAHDLALVELDQPVSADPLVSAIIPPETRPPLLAVGFPNANTVPSSVDVSLRALGGKVLKDLVTNSALREAIRTAGAPSLLAEIIDLQGPILPGMSGGPVIDYAGGVIGICNGGLDRGATDIVWAMPAAKLAGLRASTETLETAQLGSLSSSVAFSTMTADDASAPPVVAGDRRYLKVRTRKLSDFTRYTDDPLGLDQLKAQFASLNPDEWEFDVYREVHSGATLVVPAGAALHDNHGEIVVRPHPIVLMVARISKVNDPSQAQAESLRFEGDLKSNVMGEWWVDNPQWSYIYPITYQNGLVVRRRSYVRQAPWLNQWGQPQLNAYGMPMAQVRSYLMITFAVQHGALFSVAARRDDLSTMGRGDAADIAWGKAILAVQLATFPAEDQVAAPPANDGD